MINKLQFNNLVISNKKKIRTVHAQTVRKLVQKIKKLKVVLDQKPDQDKIKERLRKATECLYMLKKLKCLEIIKKALVLEKNPNAILSNGNSSPAEIAIAMLAMNSLMSDIIKHFRKELKLQNEESSWKEELLQISKRRAKIQKTEEKRKKRKELKEQKVLALKRLEWIEQNQPRKELHVSDVSGTWKIEELTDVTENKIPIVHVKSQRNENKDANETLIRETKNKDQNSKKSLMFNVPNTLQITSGVHTGIAHKDKCKEVQQIKKENLNEKNTVKEIFKIQNISRGPSEAYDNIEHSFKSTKEISHVIDPFFITDTGENYLSSAFNLATDEENEYGNSILQKQPQNVRRLQTCANAPGRMDIKSRGKKSCAPGLHPSWSAKIQSRPIIKAFQGKKILFDNNKTTGDSESKKKSKLYTQNELDNANLHPSWLAKQKQKPIIANFQGKKIIFDTDA